MAEDYEYDVFISYLHKPPVFGWVFHHFEPVLKEWLSEALGRETEIFTDFESIDTGEDWPLKLQEGLKRSRCMVAVWSPRYFASNWCMAEWESMLTREKDFGFKTTENPLGLVYAVKFFDGDLFPSIAKRTQQVDLEEWNNPYPNFKDTQRYDSFIQKMQEVAKEVAEFITKAPPYKEDFKIVIPEQYREPEGLTKLPKLK